MKHSAIKTLAASLAACAALLLLASCAGGDPESGAVSSSADASAEAAAEAAAEAGLPDQTDAPLPADEDTAPSETEAPAKTPEELLAIAADYIGKPVDELIAAIGEPENRDYGPSCMGDGEDGSLYYGGFIVYTYRENGEETVQDVE